MVVPYTVFVLLLHGTGGVANKGLQWSSKMAYVVEKWHTDMNMGLVRRNHFIPQKNNAVAYPSVLIPD